MSSSISVPCREACHPHSGLRENVATDFILLGTFMRVMLAKCMSLRVFQNHHFLWAQGNCICSMWQHEAWPPLLCSDIMKRSVKLPSFTTCMKVGKHAGSFMGRPWRATKMHLVCIQKCVIPCDVYWYGLQSILSPSELVFAFLLSYFFSCFLFFLSPHSHFPFFSLKYNKRLQELIKAWAGFCPLQTGLPPSEPWCQNLDLEHHHILYKIHKNCCISDTTYVWYRWGNCRCYIWPW